MYQLQSEIYVTSLKAIYVDTQSKYKSNVDIKHHTEQMENIILYKTVNNYIPIGRHEKISWSVDLKEDKKLPNLPRVSS